MRLDELEYGNPNQDQLVYLQKESYLDYLFNELSLDTYPLNSSDATIEELNSIVTYINTLKDKKEFIEKYNVYDKNLSLFFKEGLIKSGKQSEETSALIDNIIEDILPLLTKLKFHHQRPRPFQLALYYKLKLFPFKSYSNDSPSYPSGHSFQAKIITEVIGNIYPNLFAPMQKLCNDISYSRLYLGFHYQSDLDAGINCAKKVLASKSFTEKYKI